MRFIDGLVIKDEQLGVWIVQFVDFSEGLGNGARIILAADGDDLHELFWVVEVVDFLNSFAVDILFMPRRQQDGEGEMRVTIDGGSMIEPGVIGTFPDEEAQTYVKGSLRGHQCGNKQKEHFQEVAKRSGKHYFFLSTNHHLTWCITSQCVGPISAHCIGQWT